MRAVIKRVSEAAVTIRGDPVASIARGLCVLVAFHKDDTNEDLAYILEKILDSRVFSGVEGVEESTVVEQGLEILCVSHPVLFAVVRANGLEYPEAMSDEGSEACFRLLVTALNDSYGNEKIKQSLHDDFMEVHFDNDGAVTLMLDSKSR